MFDRQRRKKYQRDAALAQDQGWKVISVAPEHLLELLRSYTPPTQDEKDREIQRLKTQLHDARVVSRQHAAAAQRADEVGYARAVRDLQPELDALRKLVRERGDSVSL